MGTDTRARPPSPAVAEHPPGADPLRVRANKLDLLERLADDLAHEIKNPLHSMVINLEVLKRRVARVTGTEQEQVQRYIGVLSGELERVTRRVELLLRLSRPGGGAETTTLNELVEELMELIQLEGRHHEAAVEYRPGTRPARVHVPREPARQVLLNLVLDALDAAAPGSTLYLSVENAGDEARVVLRPEPPPDPAAGEPWRRLEVAAALAGSIGGTVEARDGEVVFALPATGG